MSDRVSSQDRATRFLARVDRQLEALATVGQRLDFLNQQIEGWQHRYARFICTEGRSEPDVEADDPPHSSDFLLTILELGKRRALILHRAGVIA